MKLTRFRKIRRDQLTQAPVSCTIE